MALDDLQARVLRTIAANRSPESPIAGGAVLQRHRPRLSDDIDVFHHDETSVELYARLDLRTLRDAGFSFDVTRRYPGFVEAVVGTETEGRTRLQWTMEGEYRFLRPVQDATFGWRLQIPDLAVNKLIAAATRGEPRDFVDLAFIDKHYMPLWTLAWAAPGKDESFSPLSYLTQIERRSLAAMFAIADVLGAEAFDGKTVRRRLLRGIEIARAILPKLDPNDAGKLYTGPDGVPVLRPERARAERGEYGTLAVTRGGSWPVIPELERGEIMTLSELGDRGDEAR